MIVNFYDQVGSAIAYTDDLKHIYLFSGDPIAYIEGDSIYNYEGRHLGWYDDGWIYDHYGGYVYFTESANGGPLKPIRMIKPVKGIKGIRPLKGLRALKPLKPIRSLNWSDFEGDSFFIE